MQLRKTTVLVVPLSLLAVVGCSGSNKSPAEKATDSAAKAKAACHLFTSLKTPTGTSDQAQIQYAKLSAQAFRQSADLAKEAMDGDPQWTSLQSSANRLADDFELIVKASTEGFTTTDGRTGVLEAVADAKNARVIFIRECGKADPGSFSGTSSPSPTSDAAKTKKG